MELKGKSQEPSLLYHCATSVRVYCPFLVRRCGKNVFDFITCNPTSVAEGGGVLTIVSQQERDGSGQSSP